MKLLVTSYDNTFNDHRNTAQLERNIKSTKRFMSSDNAFAIATPRSYNNIKRDIDLFDIQYNYLLCDNGRILMDYKGDVKFFIPFFLHTLCKTLKYLENCGIFSSIKLIDIYGNETRSYYFVTKILCTVEKGKLSQLSKIKDELNFLEVCGINNGISLAEKSDNVESINSLAKREGFNKNDIYTIGANKSDEAMLREFNGYRVPNSDSILNGKRINQISSVNALVRKLEK